MFTDFSKICMILVSNLEIKNRSLEPKYLVIILKTL